MNRAPLVSASTLLGVGLGGFVDGIVFHQVLQAHSMLSAKVDRTTVVGLETTMFWDGVFHAFTWLMTALGLALLWRAMGRSDVPHSTATFAGGLLLGWGVFNLVEGIVDHHILHLHHVVERPDHLMFDLAFLGVSIVLVISGWMLIHAGERDVSPRVHGSQVEQPPTP